jgi:hypothetical protein
MKQVKIWFMESSEPIAFARVLNTYTKGPLFCVYCDNNIVYKYPVDHIFSIKEEYGEHSRQETK